MIDVKEEIVTHAIMSTCLYPNVRNLFTRSHRSKEDQSKNCKCKQGLSKEKNHEQELLGIVHAPSLRGHPCESAGF